MVCARVCMHVCMFSTDHFLAVDRLTTQRAQGGVVKILPDFLGGFDVRGMNIQDVQCLFFFFLRAKETSKKEVVMF